jgi:hypothetical protein
MYKSIDGEEMHVHVECGFERLGKRLEPEKAMEKEQYCDFRHSLNVLCINI